MKKIRITKPMSTGKIILTPFIDVLTVLLLFLLGTFSPDESTIEVPQTMTLPSSPHSLRGIPHLRVAVSESEIKINGEIVPGLDPSAKDWSAFRAHLEQKSLKDEKAVLIMADRGLSYKWVDLAAARISAAGFSDIYFLTNVPAKEEVH